MLPCEKYELDNKGTLLGWICSIYSDLLCEMFDDGI